MAASIKTFKVTVLKLAFISQFHFSFRQCQNFNLPFIQLLFYENSIEFVHILLIAVAIECTDAKL